MLHVILYRPQIPPNTGNVIRLCANTGASLHLVHPLGFELSEKRMRRAGLDYHEYAEVREYPDLETCLGEIAAPAVYAFTTRGRRRFDQVNYAPGDALLFGPETSGLPPALLETLPPGQRLRIPMRAGMRSLNLSNAVAVAVYEAWRQNGFK